MGHFLDEFVEHLYQEAKNKGLSKKEATEYIRKHFPTTAWLGRSARRWDGGYVIAGWIGTGWGFVIRDPLGIRPACYFASEEVVAVASEAAALQNVFQTTSAQVQELPPAHALIVSPTGQWSIERFTEPAPQSLSCSFERIYFSRGNNPAIYQERKALGALLAHEIARILDYDLEKVVFTYIPNTSQVAFWGMLQELERLLRERLLTSLEGKPLTREALQRIAQLRLRAETLIWKDTQSRTFISAPSARIEMSRHVYDVVSDSIRPHEDTLVCLDDSIVRGTTLRETLLRTLARLQPARLIIASSAPQLRYPDFYGIDMASLHDLVAFQAAIHLLQETGQEGVIHATYHRCREAYGTADFSRINFVQAIYAPFTEAQIAARIAQLVRSPELEIPLMIVYQPIRNLAQALPHHRGDWYFTGNYPTPGGYEQVNRAFMQFYEGKVQQRAYEKVSS
ncbi:MAG: amidophosphoribosyltransferase [Bacteroidia bacterium]|nr:amidophosphoribosyltransferase [Bacteroidia bacterium]